MGVCARNRVCTVVAVWRSEDHWWKSVLLVHHVGSGSIKLKSSGLVGEGSSTHRAILQTQVD